MGEGVLEKSAAGRFADDPPVEQLVERLGKVGFVPGADVPNGIARKAIADARRDLGGGARRLREALEPPRHDAAERSGRCSLVFAHVDDELR